MKKAILGLSILGIVVFLMTDSTRGKGILAEELDQKYDQFTYIVESDTVSVGVAAYVARFREKEDYMPLEIGIANKMLDKLTLKRNSFILIDEDGNQYSLTPVKELLENYHKQESDLQIVHITQISRSLFGGLDQVQSNFQPGRVSDKLVTDKVELPKWYYMIDMLYFPRPATGIKGKKFTFRINTPELAQPIQVRFRVD